MNKFSNHIKQNAIYTLVLKSGSHHNLLSSEINENVLIGNIAVGRIMYMFDRKGQGKCEFGFCENHAEIEKMQDINVIEATRVFVVIPNLVIVPMDNIGLIEESAFPYFRSKDSFCKDVVTNDEDILEKIPFWKAYHSEIGGFYQNPVIIKKDIPIKANFGGPVKQD